MPDYGLLGGIGDGLKSFTEAYQASKQRQDQQKEKQRIADRLDRQDALQAKIGGVQLNQSGGYDYTPEKQKQVDFENAAFDPNSARTKAGVGARKGLLGSVGLDPSGFVPEGSSLKDMNDADDIIKSAATIRGGLLQEKEKSKRERATKQPTDSQFNAAMFGKRSEASDKIIQELGNYRSTPGGKLDSMAPGLLMSDTAKKIDQAERNFVNAILRRESGAAISESEFKNAEAQYFPRSGDPQDVIDQKAQNRAQGILGLQAASGDAWEKVPMAGGPLERNLPRAGMQKANVIQQGVKPVHKMTRAELLKELGG